MKSLENFLNAYRMNLEFFDLDRFAEEIMDIPHQIESIEKMYDKMSEEEKNEFFRLNKRLSDIIERVEPKDEMQVKILEILRNTVEKEAATGKIAA